MFAQKNCLIETFKTHNICLGWEIRKNNFCHALLTECWRLYKQTVFSGRRSLKILFYFQILDPVCHQLFEFYRSEERELQRFSLELVPSLVWLYLSFISRGQKSVSTLFPVQSLYDLSKRSRDNPKLLALDMWLLNRGSLKMAIWLKIPI